EYLYSEYNSTIAQYRSVKGQLNYAKSQYEEGLKKYEESLVKYEKEIAEGEQQLKLARAQLNDLPKSQWIILNRDQQYSSMMYKSTCLQMGTVGLYMPVMFFLVAALVCLTTMKRLVDEQRGQIGVYVALGYSNMQIIGKYVSYALLASLTGGISGIVFGQMLFPSVIYSTWRMMYYLPPIKIMFPVKYAVLSVGSFSVLMAFITAYVVHNCIKDVPASLMRPVAPKKGKIIFLQRIPFIWNMLSFTSKITARNIFRYKSRFLMTIAGIAGCCGLLIMGFGIKDSVSDVLGIQYREIFRYNDLIYFKNNEHINENLEILDNSADVDYATTYMEYTTRAYISGNEKTANAIVIDQLDYYTLFDLKETDKKTSIRLNNDGVIVSQQFAKNNGLEVGDVITIESKNRIKGDVQIADICEMYFQHYIFMSDTLYSNTFDEDISKATIAVLSDDDDAVRKTVKGLKDYASIISTSYYLDSFNNMIEALNLVIMVIILVAGSLAFVVLVNLTQVNISERIREIATLKVLGFNDHEVNMYIFKEILLLSVIGCFVGIPIGFFEHRFIMSVLNMEMIMFARTIKFISIILSFVITIVFTIIVLFFMKKPLREVNMIESLKSVD
ncbi:MAG: ABC transporter permease, partial [Erysipelotrichaceae bacterium]|nr:ABC transporter permease [Erysipelotrichaceae bacterium]